MPRTLLYLVAFTLDRTFPDAFGKGRKVDALGIDSGYRSHTVYTFVRARQRLPDRRAEEPERAHLLEDLAMDLTAFVPLADVRLDLGLDEAAGGIADELVLVGQPEVDHRQSIVWRCKPTRVTRDRQATAAGARSGHGRTTRTGG